MRATPVVDVAGVSIPLLGFGTYRLMDEPCAAAVAAAIAMGYAHIDTAQAYGNEAAVGEGIRRAGRPRDAVFVTTKIWREQLRDGDLQASVETSLAQLGLDHVDLLLVHWPNTDVLLAETLGALADAKRRGMTRAIGVSNFPAAMLEEAARISPEPIAVNQIEYHPFLSQHAVLAATARTGIAATAYSPLAQGLVSEDPVLREIAAARGFSPAQVALCWILQQGVGAIPKTASVERAAQNLAILGERLSPAEMAAINALGGRRVRTVDFAFAPAWDTE